MENGREDGFGKRKVNLSSDRRNNDWYKRAHHWTMETPPNYYSNSLSFELM